MSYDTLVDELRSAISDPNRMAQIIARELDNIKTIQADDLAQPLVGFSAGAGTVSAADSIISAFNKVVGNIATKPAKPSTITTLGVTANLVGVDGTASNAAPLVETESRLDAIEAKLDALITALNA